MGLLHRRRSERSLVSDADRENGTAWLQGAEDWVENGGRMSWLTTSIMLPMALGYAVNVGNKVPPVVYSSLIRVGYALRFGVGYYAVPEPLDVSMVDPAAVIRELATLPRDHELGAIAPDTSDEQDALMAPIVELASNTAESSTEFARVVSVEPALWNAVASMATAGLQVVFKRNGLIRRPRDLDPMVAESFLRYGFVFRALDEALRVDATAAHDH